MTDITWVAGDKPLPLQVSMDLTGAVVEVTVRDYDDPDGAWGSPLTETVTAPAAGDLEVDTSSLAHGRYEIRVRVSQGGVVVATFPNDGDRQLLTIIP